MWLTQAQMSELFSRSIATISRHISNIFADGELEEKSNLQKMQIAFSDKPVALYSLDVILAVGFRVKSSPWHSVPPLGKHHAQRILEERLCHGR